MEIQILSMARGNEGLSAFVVASPSWLAWSPWQITSAWPRHRQPPNPGRVALKGLNVKPLRSAHHIASAAARRSLASATGNTRANARRRGERSHEGRRRPNTGDTLCFVWQGFREEEEEDSVSHLLHSPHVSSFCLTSTHVESDNPAHRREEYWLFSRCVFALALLAFNA